MGLIVALCVLAARLADHGIYIGDVFKHLRDAMDVASENNVNEQVRRARNMVQTDPSLVGTEANPDNVRVGVQALLASPQNAITDLSAGDLGWIDPSWATRQYNRQVAKALVEMTTQRRTATGLLHATTQYEQQRVALREVQERARVIPYKIDLEISEVQKRQERARHDAEMAAQEKCRKQHEAERRQELAEQDHLIAMLKRKAEIARLEGILSEPTAAPKPKRKSKPEAPAVEPAPEDQVPDVLRRHLAEQDEVKVNRAEAARRVTAIHERAAADGRDITDDEQDEIDAIQEALARAEAEIRQGGASDL
jgi:hypothetical protein